MTDVGNKRVSSLRPINRFLTWRPVVAPPISQAGIARRGTLNIARVDSNDPLRMAQSVDYVSRYDGLILFDVQLKQAEVDRTNAEEFSSDARLEAYNRQIESMVKSIAASAAKKIVSELGHHHYFHNHNTLDEHNRQRIRLLLRVIGFAGVFGVLLSILGICFSGISKPNTELSFWINLGLFSTATAYFGLLSFKPNSIRRIVFSACLLFLLLISIWGLIFRPHQEVSTAVDVAAILLVFAAVAGIVSLIFRRNPAALTRDFLITQCVWIDTPDTMERLEDVDFGDPGVVALLKSSTGLGGKPRKARTALAHLRGQYIKCYDTAIELLVEFKRQAAAHNRLVQFVLIGTTTGVLGLFVLDILTLLDTTRFKALVPSLYPYFGLILFGSLTLCHLHLIANIDLPKIKFLRAVQGYFSYLNVFNRVMMQIMQDVEFPQELAPVGSRRAESLKRGRAAVSRFSGVRTFTSSVSPTDFDDLLALIKVKLEGESHRLANKQSWLTGSLAGLGCAVGFFTLLGHGVSA